MSLWVQKFMPNILNRDILNHKIYWSHHQDQNESKEVSNYLKRMVNRWKRLLHQNGAVKGNLVTISLLGVDTHHVTSIIACAEMGLKMIILDSPATMESLPYTKLALHGPSDFYLHKNKEGDKAYNGLHGEMLRRYGGKPINAHDLSEMSPDDFITEDIYPDDPLLMSSTSGTTKPSRPVYFSHREVMTISRRNVEIFKFDENSKVVHARNLHHASAMLTSLLPSLMVANHHFTFPVSPDYIMDTHKRQMEAYQKIREDEYTHIMMPNKATLMDFLETYHQPFKTKLHINMCGFSLDQSFVELAERYNLEFHSHYGSIDTAIPLLINFVDKDSVVEENCLGVLADDFYRFDGKEVMCDLWDKPRYMEDDLVYRNEKFYIKPRKETSGRYLSQLLVDFPEDIDIDLFFQDTKLNYEQLRGHIKEVRKRYDNS